MPLTLFSIRIILGTGLVHNMNKKILVYLFLFIGICPLAYSMENAVAAVVIKSSNDNEIFGIHIGDGSNLFAEKMKSKEDNKVKVQSYWNTFLNINDSFSKEVVSKIESILRGSLHLCGQAEIGKTFLPERASVFGDVSPAYTNKNISISPDKTHAIIKTALGPYVLLNLTTFELEDICIENGAHVLWGGEGFVVIALAKGEGGDGRGGPNAIIAYNIATKRSYYKAFSEKRVEDIKWAIDEDKFLVLVSSKQVSVNPLNWILGALGHATTYSNFELKLISRELNHELSSVQLSRKVPNGYAFINSNPQILK